MSEAKYLPGPWKGCGAKECTCGIVWSIPGDFPVCTAVGHRVPVAVVHEHMADAPDIIYQSLTDRAVVMANARLIAAAPDLLEAVKALCEADRDELNDSTSEVWNRAVDAINKAERPAVRGGMHT